MIGPLMMNVCGRCGQQWFGAHYCTGLSNSIQYQPGAQIARQLTEDDVRRIVREELAKSRNPTDGGTTHG